MAQLELYHQYSRAEAVARLSTPSLRTLCDDQFVICSNSILVFADLGNSHQKPGFSRPDRFVWIPAKDYQVSTGSFPWLPRELDPRVENNGEEPQGGTLTLAAKESRRAILLLARARSAELFTYVGTLYLASYGYDSRRRFAEFELEPKLSREMWSRLYGYAWELRLNDEYYRANSTEEILHHLERMHEHNYMDAWLWRYEADELSVLMTPTEASIVYGLVIGDGDTPPEPSALFAINPAYRGDIDATIEEPPFRLSNGEGVYHWPVASIIPRSMAFDVLIDYVKTSDLPKWVQWERF